MLNVNRQRVTQLREHPDFPAPWVTLATGVVWRDTDVVAWATRHGRTITPLELDVAPPYGPGQTPG